MLERKGKKRNVCIFVNPISGQKKAKTIVESKLLPKLDLLGLDYTVITTSHEAFMDEFFHNLSPSEFPFTDVALCGGDGLNFQYFQAIRKSRDAGWFESIPLCLIPGGSHNGLASDYHGAIANHAVTNLLRGTTCSKELMKTTDVVRNKSYVSLGMGTGYLP